VLDSLRALVARLRPDGGLRSRTVKSGVWSGGINVSARLLETVSVIVVARVLGPREFGLMGIALLVYAALGRFSRLGMDRALVQREEADVDAYLDTAFVLQLVRGAVLAAVLLAGAPLVARLFGEPQVTDILRVIALSPLLAALINPSIVYFEKDLELHRKFGYELSGAGAKFLVTVALALSLQNVWALVFGFLAADVGKLVASYALHGYRPWPRFDTGRARDLLGYGKWITATSGVTFLLTSGDDALVGAVLSATALGYYRLGYQFGKTPTMELSRSLSTVVFPAYAKLQNDAAALADAVQRTVRLLAVLSFPAAVGLVVVAPAFVVGVLGEQWRPVIPVMQIVAVYGAFSALTSAFNDVWNALGRPDINTKLNVLRLVVTGALVYPATVTYGMVGTVAVIAGVFLAVVVPLKFYLLVASIDTSYRQLLPELAYPTLASGAMAAVLFPVRAALDGAGVAPVVALVVLVAVGVVAYAAVVLVLESGSGWGIGDDVRTVVETVRG
jgi:PST family polysaccharide transporter/lipopolysaccharide exporter